MRIAVTGASGFIGQALVERLLAEGHEVSGGYASRKPEARTGLSLQRIEGLNRQTDWRPLLQGCQAVAHLAARAHVAESGPQALQRQREANLAASLALANQAAEAGIGRLVFLSSIGARSPRTPYQIAKREAEDALSALCREKGLELVILRPPLVVGPKPPGNLARLLSWIEAGRPLPFGFLANARSFLALGNLTGAIALSLTHPAAAGGRFELADAPPLSTPDLARLLARGLGRKPRLFPCPPGLLSLALKTLGRGEMAESLLGSLTADASVFSKRCGWKPEITLEAAVLEMAADWKSGREP